MKRDSDYWREDRIPPGPKPPHRFAKGARVSVEEITGTVVAVSYDDDMTMIQYADLLGRMQRIWVSTHTIRDAPEPVEERPTVRFGYGMDTGDMLQAMRDAKPEPVEERFECPICGMDLEETGFRDLWFWICPNIGHDLSTIGRVDSDVALDDVRKLCKR